MKRLEARIDQLHMDVSGNDPSIWTYWNRYYEDTTPWETIYREGPYEVLISKLDSSMQKTVRPLILADSIKNFRVLHPTEIVERQSHTITVAP